MGLLYLYLSFVQMYRSVYRDWLSRFESRYITLTMKRDLEYCHELPVENSSVLVVIVDKNKELGQITGTSANA
jgi:hypothetical protein